MAHVEAIFTSATEGGSARPIGAIVAVAGKGVVGDRHWSDEGLAAGRQLTLIQAEHVERLSALGPGEHRRQVVTRAVALNDLVGSEFMVGEVTVRGVELCEPCAYLEERTYKGVMRDLVHKGGLNAEILTDGTIRVGDTISI